MGGLALFACLIKGELSPIDILWTFSIFLEALAIVPQLFVLQRYREVENLTGLYVLDFLRSFSYCAAVVRAAALPGGGKSHGPLRLLPGGLPRALHFELGLPVVLRAVLPPQLARVHFRGGADGALRRLFLLLRRLEVLRRQADAAHVSVAPGSSSRKHT